MLRIPCFSSPKAVFSQFYLLNSRDILELHGLSDARNELIFRCQDFDRLHDIQFPCGLGCSLLRRTIMHQDVNNKEETASTHAQKT